MSRNSGGFFFTDFQLPVFWSASVSDQQISTNIYLVTILYCSTYPTATAAWCYVEFCKVVLWTMHNLHEGIYKIYLSQASKTYWKTWVLIAQLSWHEENYTTVIICKYKLQIYTFGEFVFHMKIISKMGLPSLPMVVCGRVSQNNTITDLMYWKQKSPHDCEYPEST